MSPIRFALLADPSECRNSLYLLSTAYFVESFALSTDPVDYLDSFPDLDIIEAIAVYAQLVIARN